MPCFRFPLQIVTAARPLGWVGAWLLVLAAAGCANPVAPTGGPRDEEPPELVLAEPAAGATEVALDARTVELTFSEYVDETSFARALDVTPAFDQPPMITWRGRRARVELPEALRDSTTYILTIGTDLRDANGVALKQPITIAFATGPTINQGRLAGRVVEPEVGQPVAGLDVYAYAAPDSAALDALPERPAYRTQTDDDGRFAFEYLREQPYVVIALEDLNRNRQPDPTERYAVPPVPVLVADTTAPALGAPFIATKTDAVPPEVQRVRGVSDQRLAIRFDEAVRLPDSLGPSAAWAVTDSLTGAAVAVRQAYTLPERPQEVYLWTAPLRPQPYRVTLGAVVDSAGNAPRADTLWVTPPATPDTFSVRFSTFLPDSVGTENRTAVAPRTQPGVRLTLPADSATLAQALAAADTAGTPRAVRVRTDDGVTYRLRFEPPLAGGDVLDVRFDARAFGADTTYSRRFRRLADRDLGERSGVILPPDASGPLIVELIPERGGEPYRTTAQPDGEYLIGGLPDGNYRLRAFVDRDGDGQWDGGSITPYVPPEPVLWHPTPLDVRPRWNQALEDTLRFADLGSGERRVTNDE